MFLNVGGIFEVKFPTFFDIKIYFWLYFFKRLW